MMQDIKKLLQQFPTLNRDTLIPILQAVQNEYGYLSEDAIKQISEFLHLPSSKIYGLATFYNQFRFSPKGKYHIQVCNGTTCHMKGAAWILKEVEKILDIRDGETTRDGLFSLEILSCIGACGHAPVICINGTYYNRMDKKKLEALIREYKELHDAEISG